MFQLWVQIIYDSKMKTNKKKKKIEIKDTD